MSVLCAQRYRSRVRVRRRKAVFALVGPVTQAVGYVLVPLLVSRTARRHGWRGGRPGPANLAGLIPLGGGAATIGAAILSHYRAAPAVMRVSLTPEYLVTGGVYARTRNPLYLGGALMQLGWAVLLGSVPGAMALSGFLVAMDSVGIPFEERLLHSLFGPTYDTYRDRVPRWV